VAKSITDRQWVCNSKELLKPQIAIDLSKIERGNFGSAEGATGLKPGVERSGTPGTDLRADER
jgi:hypothetical protein